ncbi:hypothetical protein PAXRUDRAFT_240987 [Paxillus rubicundulus Ve08.2h10]|uniref:Uncharacterized protein n=1 Tax=Paxillus rubicundulus Ve08.2h10 TaxID=930991 RepID=A0A0D0DGC4_9AGAM|nr:hypothetical protein PAXRUDRAFT_240987 [Paxillus rubicundulus Ve08.2h10]
MGDSLTPCAFFPGTSYPNPQGCSPFSTKRKIPSSSPIERQSISESNRNNWCGGDPLASSDTCMFRSAFVVQRPAAAQTEGADRARTHTHKSIRTQRSDGGEEDQEGPHGKGLISGSESY